VSVGWGGVGVREEGGRVCIMSLDELSKIMDPLHHWNRIRQDSSFSVCSCDHKVTSMF